MITRYALIAALIAAIAAGGWITMLQLENSRLSEQNDRLEREVAVQREAAEQARLSREVAEAYRQREAARADEKERALEALLTGDLNDADTVIDPRITDFLDCLRRATGGDTSDCTGGIRGPANPGAD